MLSRISILSISAFLDFNAGKTKVSVNAVDEGSELVANCATGSIFYPQNETTVEWHLTSRDGASWTQQKQPAALQPNNSFLTVATYKETARREHNGMRIVCRLYFRGVLRVESEPQALSVYCMP